VRELRGAQLYKIAEHYFIGGAGAAGRYHPTLGRPLYLERADGAYLYDVDGNRYIDYHTSSGASFLGHNHPAIRSGIERALQMGFFCNHETEYHVRLARQLSEMVPSAERVRFNNSGTEATMAAIRLARGVTGRSKILKFEGHFHGMHDYVFYNAHNRLGEVLPTGEIAHVHDSGGVPSELDALITVIPWNDREIFAVCMRHHRGEFAAVIMEPIMYNAGCILPRKEFMQFVRAETTRDGTALIYDEVLSGFRMGPGGAQQWLGVTPDLTCLAKALGCGLPIAAVVGMQETMKGLNPDGPTVVSGTYTGHLIEVLGALSALEEIRKPGFYDRVNGLAQTLYDGINESIRRHGIRAICQGLGARFAIYFGLDEAPVTDFRRAAATFDQTLDRRFLELTLERGLYFHDYGRSITPMHHGFSASHSREDIEETLNRLDDVFAELSRVSARAGGRDG
jgi:glutamate-1-semialdehyde 2,1-aminomutase